MNEKFVWLKSLIEMERTVCIRRVRVVCAHRFVYYLFSWCIRRVDVLRRALLAMRNTDNNGRQQLVDAYELIYGIHCASTLHAPLAMCVFGLSFA